MNIISRLGGKLKFEFTARIIAVLSGGALTVALARLLRPSEYGILFLAVAIFDITTTFSRLGIGKSTGRYISEYKERGEEQIPHILIFGFLLTLFMTVVTCSVLLISHRQIARLAGEENLSNFLLLGSVFVSFSTFTLFVRFTLQGFDDIKSSSVIFMSERGIRAVSALGLVVLGFGAIGALAGYVIASMISALGGLGYLYKKYYIKFKRNKVEQGLRKRIAKYSIPLVASNAARTVDDRVDIFLIGIFINPIAVAYYTVSKQIIDLIQVPISSLTFAFSPTIKSEVMKGNLDSAANMYEEALSYTLLLYVPAAAGLIILSKPLIQVIFGDKYIAAVPVLQVLAVYAILLSISGLTGNSLDFLGYARERAIVKGVTSVANAGLNVFLIPQMGVFGAAVATVITHSVFTFSTIYFISLEIEIRKWRLLKYSIAVVTITTLMSSLVYLLSRYINGVSSLLMVVSIGVITWASLSIIIGLVDLEEVIQIIH